jgi:hypothetical protein
MMQHLPGKRVLALVVGLAAAAVGSAYAQDTTETGRASIDTTAPGAGAIDTGLTDTSATRDTTDTSGVQNPPGYRGMERDTTIFPDTGTATRDTTDTSGVQNPPGYRGMERDTTIFPPDTGTPPEDTGAVEDQPTGADTVSGADTASGADTVSGADTTSAADTTSGTDTTSVGETEPVEPDAATPRLDPSEHPAGDTAGHTPDSTQ